MERAQRPTCQSASCPVGLEVGVLPSDDEAGGLPGLPPLDLTEDGDTEGPLEDRPFADDLGTTADEDSPAWEDDPETALDVGVEISDVGDVSLSSEPVELVLDIGQLLNVPNDEIPCALEDERGPALPPSYDDLDDVPDQDNADARDGLDESVETLVSEALPGLDADDAEDGTSYLDWGSIGTASCDEPLPTVAALPWTERSVDPPLEATSSVAVSGEEVVAGGRYVCWLDRCLKVMHRVAMPGARVIDLTCPGGVEHAICATATGEVFRVTRHGDSTVRVDQWRPAAGVRVDEPVTLSLCSSPHSRSAVLGRASNGRLVRSEDAGLRWSGVELHGRVVRLSAGTTPVVALLEARGRRRLMVSDDVGLNWRALDTDSEVALALEEDDVLLAATGNTIAVAHPSHGLWIRADGGSFYRVPGCAGVTALTAAAPRGREFVWLSVFEEVAQRSHIVMVDALGRDATTIARIQSNVDEDTRPDNVTDHCRINALTWAENRLWAAGGLGLTSFSRVASPLTAS